MPLLAKRVACGSEVVGQKRQCAPRRSSSSRATRSGEQRQLRRRGPQLIGQDRAGSSYANSEIIWMVYPFARVDARYVIGEPSHHFTKWADVEVALREGTSTPDMVLEEVKSKIRRNLVRVIRT